tara:strand:- start:579 stop:800 length:222 start_codon:yes stop_codon:yes gene_type:complete
MPIYSSHNGKRKKKMTSQQKQQLRNEQAIQDNKISDQQKKDEQEQIQKIQTDLLMHRLRYDPKSFQIEQSLRK